MGVIQHLKQDYLLLDIDEVSGRTLKNWGISVMLVAGRFVYMIKVSKFATFQ